MIKSHHELAGKDLEKRFKFNKQNLALQLLHALPFLQCLLHSRLLLPPYCAAARPQLKELPLSAPCSAVQQLILVRKRLPTYWL